MAPKRRGNKVVGSVVKTKVVKETVEVIVADDHDVAPEAEQQQLVPEVLAVASPAADVSGSTVVRVRVVEVTTPDGDDNNATTGSNAVQPAAAKRGRGRREEKQPAPPEEDSVPVVPQSQDTQDPNEEQDEDEDDPSKKKQKQQQDEAEENQPESPRVASERKATPKKTKPKKPKPKPKPQQQQAGGGSAAGKTKRNKARRRLGQASSGGDAGMGGIGGYKRYVWRVLKQVHPDLGMSGHAMHVLDMMMADMFERLANEAARLTDATGRMTLTSREVQSAVRLVLPGELGKHAISEGTKAISKYMSY